MHYYSHNIKDFDTATRHLTRVERSLYRDATELYYRTEKPLTSDFSVLFRRLMAANESEKEALRYVIAEFFYLDGDVYRNKRCDEEIDRYHSKNAAQSLAGKASAEARRKKREEKIKQDSRGEATGVKRPLSIRCTNEQPTSNQQPLTKNQEKESTKEKPAKKTRAKKDNFNAFFKQYPAHRKGGTSSQAWKAWSSEGLGEDDAALALSWLEKAAANDPEWEKGQGGQYVLGITNFIKARHWLTPLPRNCNEPRRQSEIKAGAFERHGAGAHQEQPEFIGDIDCPPEL